MGKACAGPGSGQTSSTQRGPGPGPAGPPRVAQGGPAPGSGLELPATRAGPSPTTSGPNTRPAPDSSTTTTSWRSSRRREGSGTPRPAPTRRRRSRKASPRPTGQESPAPSQALGTAASRCRASAATNKCCEYARDHGTRAQVVACQACLHPGLAKQVGWCAPCVCRRSWVLSAKCHYTLHGSHPHATAGTAWAVHYKLSEPGDLLKDGRVNVEGSWSLRTGGTTAGPVLGALPGKA